MMRDLFNNTLLAGLAFFINGLLGILVVPVIVTTWGLAAYGLIILARFFIPQGFLAIADLGASEIVTQAVARARVHQNWAAASERVGFVAAASAMGGLVIGIAVMVSAPLWARLFDVDPAHADDFRLLLTVTGIALWLLFPGLVAEGIVKGFERFAALRILEVVSMVGYVAAALICARVHTSYLAVALAYLGFLVGRYLILGLLAYRLSRTHGLSLTWPKAVAVRQDLRRYMWIMSQSKAIGALQNQSMPALVGAIFGPSATGIFDLVIRLPRFAKQALSVLSTSLLPVSARIEEHGAMDRMRRLGHMGLIVLPAVTVPPLVGAAVLSEPILHLWVGPEFAPLWPWMAVMFAVPIAAQYLGFGGVVMLARPTVQALLNRVALIQTLVMALIAVALMGVYAERGFILAQAAAALLPLPVQLWILAREFGVRRREVARALGFQALLMGALAAPALLAMGRYDVVNPVEAAIYMAAWCCVIWGLEYAFLLTSDNRAEVGRMARAVLSFGQRVTR